MEIGNSFKIAYPSIGGCIFTAAISQQWVMSILLIALAIYFSPSRITIRPLLLSSPFISCLFPSRVFLFLYPVSLYISSSLPPFTLFPNFVAQFFAFSLTTAANKFNGTQFKMNLLASLPKDIYFFI
jgi:hypothetical protein